MEFLKIEATSLQPGVEQSGDFEERGVVLGAAKKNILENYEKFRSFRAYRKPSREER